MLTLPSLETLDAARFETPPILKRLASASRQLAELKQLWPRQRVDELRQLFAGWQADKRYNGTRLRSGTVSKLLDALETWASTPTQHSLDASLDWSRLSPAFLAEIWKKPELPPVVPALEALAALPGLARSGGRATPPAIPTPGEAEAEFEAVGRSHGVLLFLPLPKRFDQNAVRAALSPDKDVDGVTDGSLAGVFTGSGEGFAEAGRQRAVRHSRRRAGPAARPGVRR